MDDLPLDVSPGDSESESVGFDRTACSAVGGNLVCSPTDIGLTLPISVMQPDTISASKHYSVASGIPSENVPITHDPDCNDSKPSESDSNFDDFHPVTLRSEEFSDLSVESSTLTHNTASSVNGSQTTTQCLEDMGLSAENEVHSCVPVVAVGGAKEEELKHGLEQRLGVVLSKLAREHDEDIEIVDDQRPQQQSSQIISSHVVQGDVDNQSGTGEADCEPGAISDACADTTNSDGSADTRYILVMDIAQEMDEVERYSYVSLVAYAMHQLFEYSAWNQYVMLLLTLPF